MSPSLLLRRFGRTEEGTDHRDRGGSSQVIFQYWNKNTYEIYTNGTDVAFCVRIILKIKFKQECLPALCRTCLSVKFSKKKMSYCCHLVLTFDIRICGPPGVNIWNQVSHLV